MSEAEKWEEASRSQDSLGDALLHAKAARIVAAQEAIWEAEERADARRKKWAPFFWAWTQVKRLRFWRSGEERRSAEQAGTECERLIGELSADPATVAGITASFKEQIASPSLSDKERTSLRARWETRQEQVFRGYADSVLTDDQLTVQEELGLYELAGALGVDQQAWSAKHRDVLLRLFVARANDGRLAEIDEPTLLRKGEEAVYLETEAALMKEVAIREYQGAYGGFSFRIAKGVRYSTGRTRGRSVVVGTELQVADEGVLSVSSTRAVYLGGKKSIEFPYAKLMSIEVFDDGIRLHSSNRQTTPLFRVESGDVVAATMNEAMQRFEEAPKSRSRGTRVE